MREERCFLCVSCPIGCSLTVQLEGGSFSSISGNRCALGEQYAKSELVDPKRLFTSTVKVRGAHLSVCPVRTREAVPLKQLLEVSRALAEITVEAPLSFGQVVLSNVCGTGVDIITTRGLI